MGVQVVLSWRSLAGGWLQRVVTQRLTTTSSLQTVVSGTDWGLAAVLAGKRWVGQAQAREAAQDRRAASNLRKQIGESCLQMGIMYCLCSAMPESEPACLRGTPDSTPQTVRYQMGKLLLLLLLHVLNEGLEPAYEAGSIDVAATNWGHASAAALAVALFICW